MGCVCVRDNNVCHCAYWCVCVCGLAGKVSFFVVVTHLQFCRCDFNLCNTLCHNNTAQQADFINENQVDGDVFNERLESTFITNGGDEQLGIDITCLHSLLWLQSPTNFGTKTPSDIDTAVW